MTKQANILKKPVVYVEKQADYIIPVPTFNSAKVNRSQLPELKLKSAPKLRELVLRPGKKVVEAEELVLSDQLPELNEEVRILAQAGSQAELIMSYKDTCLAVYEAKQDQATPEGRTGPGDLAEYKRQTRLEIEAEPGSKLTLFLVQQLGLASQSRLQIRVNLGADSEVRLVIADTGAQSHGLDLVADLGDRAVFDCQSIYFGLADQVYDYNYNLIHHGQACRSNLLVNGALMDHAQKVFRGTIDFRKGSAGSVGEESEYVTLLDPTVVSRAIPLLLSTEDNVEGNHAASAGHLNPDMVFYVMTRGFSRREAEKLIIAARFSNVLDLIPDSTLKTEVLSDILAKLDLAG